MKPPPVYVGMPRTEQVFRVHRPAPEGKREYGRIICGGPCRDDYLRIGHHAGPGGQVVTLQNAAWRSFHEAEVALGYPIPLTGSWRSCAVQTALWRSDPQRFASPNVTAHPRGLAVDVSQAIAATRLKAIHRALTWRRWYQARTDEPWHYSFGIEV